MDWFIIHKPQYEISPRHQACNGISVTAVTLRLVVIVVMSTVTLGKHVLVTILDVSVM